MAKLRARGKDYALFAIVQPWVPLFWEHSEARGGDVLGLERFETNLLSTSKTLLVLDLLSYSRLTDVNTRHCLGLQLGQLGR
jgi:hypothetical protein